MDETPRRQFLAATATGGVLSIAGCSAPDGSVDSATSADDPDGAEDESPNGGDGSGGPMRSATVVVDIEDLMAEREAEIRDRLAAEEIDQEEAQEEYRSAQLEALAEATASVESAAEDLDDLTIAGSSTEAGALLVEGSAAAVLDTVEYDEVAALVPAAEFEALG